MGQAPPDEHASPAADHTWRWLDGLCLLLTLLVVAVVAVPRLPPGICFADSGELQLAAATLGITHAPGYPIFASLGYLLAAVTGADPAWMFSLGCMLAGLVVVAFCVLTQVRLGVGMGAACALALWLSADEKMWINLIAPEAYMPTLALQAGAIYCLIRYVQSGKFLLVPLGAFLLGAAMVSRPPVVMLLPFVVGAWWIGYRRHRATASGVAARGWPSFLVATLAAALPGVYSLGYLYVRDTPRTIYNYIERNVTEFGHLPDTSEGVRAKVQRVWYHATGREFDYAKGNDWRGVRNKLIWVRKQFFLYQPFPLAVMVGMMLFGAGLLWRRAPDALLMLIGTILGNLIFVCSFRMWGQAADLTPMMWAAIVLLGVAVSRVFGQRGARWTRVVGLTAAVSMAIFTVADAPSRTTLTLAGDAVPFVEELDVATLPENAIICSQWPVYPALIYASRVLASREDIVIIGAREGNWLRLIGDRRDRPLFAATIDRPVEGVRFVPWRNIWRIEIEEDGEVSRD